MKFCIFKHANEGGESRCICLSTPVPAAGSSTGSSDHYEHLHTGEPQVLITACVTHKHFRVL